MSRKSMQNIRRFSTSRFTRRALAFALPMLLLTIVVATQGMLAFGSRQLESQPTNQRTAKISQAEWPKGVLELVAVNNLQSDEFPKGFEIVVKNISDKPIYYLQINTRFENSKSILGENDGSMILHYGARRLNATASRPESNDSPLEPGQVCTLRVDDTTALNFFTHKGLAIQKRMLEEGTKRILLVAQRVSFGDGTGVVAGSEYPVKKKSMD